MVPLSNDSKFQDAQQRKPTIVWQSKTHMHGVCMEYSRNQDTISIENHELFERQTPMKSQKNALNLGSEVHAPIAIAPLKTQRRIETTSLAADRTINDS